MQASGSTLILVLLAVGAAPVAGVRRKPVEAAGCADGRCGQNASNISAPKHAMAAPCAGGHCSPNASNVLPAKKSSLAQAPNASARAVAKRVSLTKEAQPAKASNISVHATAKQVPAKTLVTKEQVQLYRAKLEAVSTKLQGMLDRKNGALGKAKLAPTLKVFTHELEQVLRNTTTVQDPAVAMRQLQAIGHSIGSLTKDLTSRQEQLMIEDESQRESLLLGVLMSKQKEPMDEQMAVLQSSDFSGLPVSKALLAAHNASTPSLRRRRSSSMRTAGAHTLWSRLQRAVRRPGHTCWPLRFRSV